MRIVNRSEFLALPENTLFCKYSEGGNLGDIEIKLDTWTEDYLSVNLQEMFEHSDTMDYFDKLDLYENNSSLEFEQDLDDCRRDGLFEEDQKFIIYNKSDIEKLINKLKELI